MAGIYIHVPFCTVKCAYCDFYSVARPDMADAYVDAVGKEYRARRHETGDAPINTLYIGGGTPSLLSPAQFAKLISYFDLGSVKEFTIEANPDDIDDAHVETWADCGVNRVSIGVQSLVDAELQAVGRRHNAGQAIEAIAKIQSHRIDNISGDLIYGLPGQTPDSFSYSLDTLLSTGIKHLSAYCLSYEEGTRLWRWLQQGRVAPTDDDIIAVMYDMLCQRARTAGFEHYEISNFALPGYRSRHNSSYWHGVPYLGLGPGAHSCDIHGTRRYVPSDIRAYITAPETAAIVDEESDTDRANDRNMTSLRTAEGLDLSQFTPAQQQELKALAAPHVASQRLVVTGRGFAIPEMSFMLSDAVIRDLLL